MVQYAIPSKYEGIKTDHQKSIYFYIKTLLNDLQYMVQDKSIHLHLLTQTPPLEIVPISNQYSQL